jgi:hypothetical protein
MSRAISVLFLLAVTLAPLHAATPQIFPDDYKPTPCAVENVCASFSRSELTGLGARMQGYTNMSQNWIDAHWDKLLTEIQPFCKKLETCYTTAGNTNMFCNDVVLTQMMTVCDQFPAKSSDYEQCFLMLRTFATGVDLKSWKTFESAQPCAKANAPTATRQLDLIMKPATLPPDFDGKIIIYALDKETRVPMKSAIAVEGEIIYSREAPDGTLTTSYPFSWRSKLRRNGSEVVAPMVTITRPGYETIAFRMPVEARTMAVTMAPAQNKLKRGKNTVTVTAKDPVTGQPVEARVLVGERDMGEANQPFELELKRGEKPAEIRVRSSFDRYNDVVVGPAAP